MGTGVCPAGLSAGQQLSDHLLACTGGVSRLGGLLHYGHIRGRGPDLAHEAGVRCDDRRSAHWGCPDVSFFSTGSIWGKPTWGTWWEWDARITSMLILLFLYLGIMALQSAFQSRDAADKASALLALIGTVNIPIIYKSVDWWHTLHQPATLKLTSAPTIHASMLYPLLTMILAFYLFYALVLLLYTRAELLQREARTRWVSDLVTEETEKR